MFSRALLVLSVLAGLPLFGQSFTASVRGVALDPTQAVIPGVAITVTDVERGLKHSTRTDDNGRYVLLSLPPGNYALTAVAGGFRTFTSSNFTLQVQQEATIDVAMTLSATETAVEVTATQPMLNMTSAGLGQVVENTYIRSVPLIDREVMRLSYLTPGLAPVNTDPGGDNQSFPTNFVSNGVRSSTSDVFIDGAVVTNLEKGSNSATFLEMRPNVETVQEFKVQTNFFSAEFGNTGGTVVNMVSKSGTNEFHGSGFLYHRRDEFNANSFFAKRQGSTSLPDFTRNKFGFAAGGPVLIPKAYNGKNRTFFHAALDVDREIKPASQQASVPTAAQLGGDFSQTVDQTGKLFTIYNPFNTYTAADGRFLRQPFPGNVIPKSIQDPVALKAIAYYPKPTSDGNPLTHVNNFFAEGTSGGDRYQAIVKIDHTIDDKQRIYGRISREWYRGKSFYAFGSPAESFQKGPFYSDAKTGVISYTRLHSASTLFEIRYGINAQPVDNVIPSRGFDPTSLGLPAITLISGYAQFPRFGPSGFAALGTVGNAGSYRATQTQNVFYSFTRTSGGHTLKGGGEARFYKVNARAMNSPAGNFAFSNGVTSENPLVADSRQGNGLASMLLGWGSSGSYGLIQPPASAHRYFGWYLQDDWKISRKLTVNLGFRYDFERPRTERYDRYSWFDFDAASPLNGKVPGYDLRGGLAFTGPDERSPFNTDWNNVQPRVGFAYALNDKTTIRSGYGIYYSVSKTTATDALGAPYDVSSPVQWSRDSNRTRYATLSNPWPDGLVAAQGKAAGTGTFIGQNLGSPSRENRNPEYQQWAFSIQRALPLRSVIEVNYTGTKGTHLYFPDLENVNRLDPSYWSLGRTELNKQVANPFYGVITDSTSGLSTRTVAQTRLLRPYPQYTGLSVSTPTRGNSSYHSMQMKYEKRFSHGFTAVASYTWAKLIDDASNSGYDTLGGDASVQNFWNLRNERSLSVMNVAHRAVVSFTYQFPFGRGRALGASWNRALDLVAGGWVASGMVTMQSGYPIVIGLASGNLLEGSQRPNLIADPSISGSVRSKLDGYFNVNAFNYPLADTYGSAPRTLNYRGPGIFNADLTLGKRLRVREGHSVELRLEGFNAFNNVVFGMPSASYGSTTFGQITGYAGSMGPRQLQVAIRYDF